MAQVEDGEWRGNLRAWASSLLMAMFAVDAEKLRVKGWLSEVVVLVRAALENIFSGRREGEF
jgi:hypothetical protein